MSTPRFIAVKLNGIIGMGINKKKKGGGNWKDNFYEPSIFVHVRLNICMSLALWLYSSLA